MVEVPTRQDALASGTCPDSIPEDTVHLPSDVLSRVFERLDFKDKLLCAPLVCKEWRTALRAPGPHWRELPLTPLLLEARSSDGGRLAAGLLAWLGAPGPNGEPAACVRAELAPDEAAGRAALSLRPLPPPRSASVMSLDAAVPFPVRNPSPRQLVAALQAAEPLLSLPPLWMLSALPSMAASLTDLHVSWPLPLAMCEHIAQRVAHTMACDPSCERTRVALIARSVQAVACCDRLERLTLSMPQLRAEWTPSAVPPGALTPLSALRGLRHLRIEGVAGFPAVVTRLHGLETLEAHMYRARDRASHYAFTLGDLRPLRRLRTFHVAAHSQDRVAFECGSGDLLPPRLTALELLGSISVSADSVAHCLGSAALRTSLRRLVLGSMRERARPVMPLELEGFLPRLAALRELRLLPAYFYDLNYMPESVSSLTGLTSLRFSCYINDNFNRLPSGITALAALRNLDVANNRLEALPDGISALGALTTLCAAHNILEELPSDLTMLRDLAILDLRSNQLTSLPEGIDQMPRLRELHIAGNALLCASHKEKMGGVMRRALDLDEEAPGTWSGAGSRPTTATQREPVSP